VRILAVDPGGTTGWMVWADNYGSRPIVTDWGEGDPESVYLLLNDLHDYHLDVIVCERYDVTVNTLKKTRQYDALELIGVLRHEAWRRGIPFVLQAQNPKFSTNARLKACGLYVKGDHGRSAARQLLLYLVKNDIDPGASPEELRDCR
jgi:hypothetical protein